MRNTIVQRLRERAPLIEKGKIRVLPEKMSGRTKGLPVLHIEEPSLPHRLDLRRVAPAAGAPPLAKPRAPFPKLLSTLFGIDAHHLMALPLPEALDYCNGALYLPGWDKVERVLVGGGKGLLNSLKKLGLGRASEQGGVVIRVAARATLKGKTPIERVVLASLAFEQLLKQAGGPVSQRLLILFKHLGLASSLAGKRNLTQ